jgi:hypothetical protein
MQKVARLYSEFMIRQKSLGAQDLGTSALKTKTMESYLRSEAYFIRKRGETIIILFAASKPTPARSSGNSSTLIRCTGSK